MEMEAPVKFGWAVLKGEQSDFVFIAFLPWDRKLEAQRLADFCQGTLREAIIQGRIVWVT